VRAVKTIAIIGAGNGGCAAAAQLTQRGFDVRLYGRSARTTQPLLAAGGIAYEGALGEGFAPLLLITNDAGAAAVEANIEAALGELRRRSAAAVAGADDGDGLDCAHRRQPMRYFASFASSTSMPRPGPSGT